MKSKNKKSTRRHTAQKSQTRQPATNSAQLSPDQLKAGGTSMLSQTISAAQTACAAEVPPSSDAALHTARTESAAPPPAQRHAASVSDHVTSAAAHSFHPGDDTPPGESQRFIKNNRYFTTWPLRSSSRLSSTSKRLKAGSDRSPASSARLSSVHYSPTCSTRWYMLFTISLIWPVRS